MKVSIVIPCYNSERSIVELVNEIICNIESKYYYQIILVNDGSVDNTWYEIVELYKKRNNIIGINLSKNYGQHAARMAALDYVSGDYVIFMDDDGQHPVLGIERIINKLSEGFDVVYAKFPTKKENFYRRCGSWLNELMAVHVIGKPKNVVQSSFFGITEYVALELKKYTSPFVYIFGGIMDITKNIANVDIEQKERKYGKSGYTLKKLIRLWNNGFYGFSLNPIKIIKIITILFAVTGIVSFTAGIFFVVNNDIIRIALTVITVIMLGFSIISGMLYLIGNYIARILLTINGKPQFTIKESLK